MTTTCCDKCARVDQDRKAYCKYSTCPCHKAPCRHFGTCDACDVKKEPLDAGLDRRVIQEFWNTAKPASWEDEFEVLLDAVEDMYYDDPRYLDEECDAKRNACYSFIRSLLASKEKEVLELAKGCVPPEGVLDPEKFPFEEKWYETHAENDGWNTCRAATLEALAKLEGKGE